MFRRIVDVKFVALLVITFASSSTFSSSANAGWYSKILQKRSAYVQCLRTPIIHFDGTIAEAALSRDDLSTLVVALDKADLVETFLGEGNFTVFAPTNAAFERVPGPVLDIVLDSPEVLGSVLGYHVTLGYVDPRYAWGPREVQTLAGQSVFLNRGDDGAQVNNANVIDCQGIRTSNGTVWLIDSVLQPQF